MKLLSAGICLLSFSGFAVGQELDPLGSGKVATYKLEDLPNDLVAVHLETSRENLRSLFQMTMYSAPYAASSTNNALTLTPDVVMQLQQVIWVPKQEALHGGDIMVGYTFDSMRLPTRENNNYDVGSVRFRLTYVRRESIISMTPREDFSPEKLRTMAQNKALPTGTSNDRAFSLSNLKQVSLSIIMLGSDYEDFFPYVQSTPQLFKFTLPYLTNSDVYKSKNPMGESSDSICPCRALRLLTLISRLKHP